MRIHTAAAVLLLYFSRYYSFSSTQYALLFLAMGLVLTAEMINTAIEKAVDLESPAFHYLARISKDVAAGAVLVAVFSSVATGFALFWDKLILERILKDILSRPLAAVAAAALLFVLIFVVPLRDDSGKKNQRR